MALLRWSLTVAEIQQVDLQIRMHQQGFLLIIEFRPFYKFKNHVVLHAADNAFRIGALRPLMCLKGG
jgi:hypothetical protein